MHALLSLDLFYITIGELVETSLCHPWSVRLKSEHLLMVDDQLSLSLDKLHRLLMLVQDCFLLEGEHRLLHVRFRGEIQAHRVDCEPLVEGSWAITVDKTQVGLSIRTHCPFFR